MCGTIVTDQPQTYDLFLIYHPDDSKTVGRIAAQLRALDFRCYFDADEFSGKAVDIAALQMNLLRSHTVAIALSPASAGSQLCNELLQLAIRQSKCSLSLILDEHIEGEVHPAIVDLPYVFFQAQDNFAQRVEELRPYLAHSSETLQHTGWLVAAETWHRGGRLPSQLLPPAELAALSQWLAEGHRRRHKPTPLLLEYIQSSRRAGSRQRWRPRRARWALGLAALTILLVGFLGIRAALGTIERAQAESAQTRTAQAALQGTVVAATAASDKALRLLDGLAGTSLALAEALDLQVATAVMAATKAAQATETQVAASAQARATAVQERALQNGARALLQGARGALTQGKREQALVLAWAAHTALEAQENPDTQELRSATYGLLRQAAAALHSYTLADVAKLQFAPDGASIAVIAASTGQLRLLDSASGQLRAEHIDQADIERLAYSRDGSILASASASELVIRAGSSGAPLQRLPLAASALAISADGAHVYTAESARLTLWDSTNGAELALANSEGDAPIQHLQLSADGGQLRAWLGQGDRLQSRAWMADSLAALEDTLDEQVFRGYSADGRYGFSGGRSLPTAPDDPHVGALTVWNMDSGAIVAQLQEGFNWDLEDLTAARDELAFLRFGEDAMLLYWDRSDSGRQAAWLPLDGGAALQPYDDAHLSSARDALILDRARLLILSAQGELSLRASTNGQHLRRLGAVPDGEVSLAASVDGELLALIPESGEARIWQLSSAEGTADDALLVLPDALPGSRLLPSGDSLLLYRGGQLSRVDITGGGELWQQPATTFSATSSQVAIYDGEQIRLHDMETGEALQHWQSDWQELQDMWLADDGTGLLVAADAALWLLGADAAIPQRIATDAARARPLQASFAPDGGSLLTIDRDGAWLWDSERLQLRAEFPLEAADPAELQAAFSADGAQLHFFLRLRDGASTLSTVELADGTVRRQSYIDVARGELTSDGRWLLLAMTGERLHIVDTESATVSRALPIAASRSRGLRYTPAASVLASIDGKRVLLWDAGSGAPIQTLEHGQPVIELQFSADGERLMTLDAAGTASLWALESTSELLQRIAGLSLRELSCVEREQFLVPPLCEA